MSKGVILCYLCDQAAGAKRREVPFCGECLTKYSIGRKKLEPQVQPELDPWYTATDTSSHGGI